MNGDPNKPQVASAQVHFASMASCPGSFTPTQRISTASKFATNSHSEKDLSAASRSPQASSPNDTACFTNAGYMGLYNMSCARLREYKGITGSGSLLDFMGKQELAANLFRVTQTEAKIKNDNIRGQHQLESVAKSVGEEVRSAMYRASGTLPENLPMAEDIKKVRGKLKKEQRTPEDRCAQIAHQRRA